MADHLAQALAALEGFDANPPGNESGTCEVIEAAHCSIALWLGLHVFEPSNQPNVTVCSEPDADPYDSPHLFSPLPDYSEDFREAVKLGPKGYRLVLLQEGSNWTASFVPPGKKAPKLLTWPDSPDPVRAIARAALAAHQAPVNR